MANIESQKKRNRQNIKRQARNRALRSELRTRIKRVEIAAAAGDPETPQLLSGAIKRIDQGTAKNIMHRNAANRTKSRLTKRVNSLYAAAKAE
ncbi:MAG: 30S ribosomal protein S20 [Acidimicrobiia bacterium]